MWWRIALLAGLLALALAVYSTGLMERLDPTSIGDLLRDSGSLGAILFVLAFSLCNGLGLPGALFMLPAIAVWPIERSFPLVWLGSVGAGIVGYAFARGLGRSFVEARLPARLRNLDARASRHPVRTVALVRMTLFLLGPSHWALGLSSIRPGALVVGSILGFLPGVALWTIAGGQLIDAFRGGTGQAWVVGLVLVAFALAIPHLVSRYRAR